MSKIYKKYQECKEKNGKKLYLFESGIFYLFIDEDAKKINKILSLKLTHLNDEIYKCGFPKKSLEKYKGLFQENQLDVDIISKEEKEYTKDFCMDLINQMKKLDINTMTPIDALNFLKELKESL